MPLEKQKNRQRGRKMENNGIYFGTFVTVIAGEWNYPAQLAPGMELFLHREPDNPHDAFAVALKTGDDVMAGYVPAITARWMAPLLDREQAVCRAFMLSTGDKKFVGVSIHLTPAGLKLLVPVTEDVPYKESHNRLLEAVLDPRKRRQVDHEKSEQDHLPVSKMLRAVLRGHVKHGYAIGDTGVRCE